MLLFKCYPLFRDFLDCFSLMRENWRREHWHLLNLYKCAFTPDQIKSWICTKTPENSSFAPFPSHSPSAVLNICVEIRVPALSSLRAPYTPLWTTWASNYTKCNVACLCSLCSAVPLFQFSAFPTISFFLSWKVSVMSSSFRKAAWLSYVTVYWNMYYICIIPKMPTPTPTGKGVKTSVSRCIPAGNLSEADNNCKTQTLRATWLSPWRRQLVCCSFSSGQAVGRGVLQGIQPRKVLNLFSEQAI